MRFHTLVFPVITPHEYDNYSLHHIKESGADNYFNVFAPSIPHFFKRSTQLRKLMLDSLFSKDNETKLWNGSQGDILTPEEKFEFYNFSRRNLNSDLFRKIHLLGSEALAQLVVSTA